MTKDELKPIDTSKYKITETGQVTRMTEEDLRKQATSTVEWENTPVLDRPLFVHAYITGAKPRENRIEELEKENAELEEKISVLLSCKNCPENNNGWVCAKEYEDKCLAQKIMFIKELKQENAELEKQLKRRAERADSKTRI